MITSPEIRAHALEVYEWITAHPENHDQATFFCDFHPEAPAVPEEDLHCGTTMCIAGTSQYLAKGKDWSKARGGRTERDAAERLGLDDPDEVNALFYEMDEKRAVKKLERIILGKKFRKKDLETVDD